MFITNFLSADTTFGQDNDIIFNEKANNVVLFIAQWTAFDKS